MGVGSSAPDDPRRRRLLSEHQPELGAVEGAFASRGRLVAAQDVDMGGLGGSQLTQAGVVAYDDEETKENEGDTSIVVIDDDGGGARVSPEAERQPAQHELLVQQQRERLVLEQRERRALQQRERRARARLAVAQALHAPAPAIAGGTGRLIREVTSVPAGGDDPEAPDEQQEARRERLAQGRREHRAQLQRERRARARLAVTQALHAPTPALAGGTGRLIRDLTSVPAGGDDPDAPESDVNEGEPAAGCQDRQYNSSGSDGSDGGRGFRRAEQQQARRERRSEQQRERRARVRFLSAQVVDNERDEAAIAQSRRERRNALQRLRRERNRNERNERNERYGGSSGCTQNRRRANKDADRSNESRLLEALAGRVLDAICITDDEVRLMAKGQNFTNDPRLALAFYYCCSTDPGSFVFGDEHLRGEGGAAVRERMGKLLDDCPTAEDIASCQCRVRQSDSEAVDLWACASCGRIVLCATESDIEFKSIAGLGEGFVVSESERDEMLRVPEQIVRQYRQVYFESGKVYHLIPDLVRDRERIPLCKKCSEDPRSSKFSVACGHDYGRVGELPALSDVALACIAPARCFGIELSLSGKQSSGHAICFPSDGPHQLNRVLPNVDPDCMPRVTFIGPKEEWRVQQQKFRKLYAIDVDGVYEWLRALSATNSIFRDEGIQVEDTTRRRMELDDMSACIEANAHISSGDVVETVDDEGQETQETHVTTVSQDEDDSAVLIQRSAVLPSVQQTDHSTVHEIVEAMITTISDEPVTRTQPTVVPVKRGRSPFVEWVDNAKILAGVFPHLFLTGSAPLPSGPLPRDFVDHFMHYWDGRFEKSVSFTSMLFNQMQRHSAVQKAARVGATHMETMEKFGKLASTSRFKEALQDAKENPETPAAVRLNAALLRLLSLVGGCVPFSPFERAATRPKLGAMRFKHGVAQHFVTVSPPEQDDLLLHRIAFSRATNAWNDETNVCSSKSCRFVDMPNLIQTSARARLTISSDYPALSAQVFERRMSSLTRDIIRCNSSSASRVSRSFLESERGVYGRVAAFNAVIEPQNDGRLHAHLSLYSTCVNPDVLTRLACCRELWPQVRQWFEGVSCTCIPPEVRKWHELWKADHEDRPPRAFEIDVPDAKESFVGFVDAARRQVLTTNTHSHSRTCRKGRRGRFMCRLARPAGVHDTATEPLAIQLNRPSNLAERRRAVFTVVPVDDSIADGIDCIRSYSGGAVAREASDSVLVWEQFRPQPDSMFVETNLALACLTKSHTNSAVINGRTSGDAVEEYQQSYMTKEGGGLKRGAAVMLTALRDIERNPSVADDSGSYLRQAKHLATRTVNAFTGGNEWSHALMVYALGGHRSFDSSDAFWYVFPHKLVSYVSRIKGRDSDMGDTASGTSDSDDDDSDVVRSARSVIEEVQSLAATANTSDSARGDVAGGSGASGARMFKVADRIVFVTQAESYRHRGVWFAEYSALEFEAIVDLLPQRDGGAGDRGRPKRKGFDLAPEHPLAPHFQAFIRTKFKTPMFGGPPPPPLGKRGRPSDAFSKYVLCLLHPWSVENGAIELDVTSDYLVEVCRKWNATGATFLNRLRYRVLENIIQMQNRSSRSERTCNEWRNRNADYWPDSRTQEGDPDDGSRCRRRRSPDYEANGVLSDEEGSLLELTTAAAAKSTSSIAAVRATVASFWALIPPNVELPAGTTSLNHHPVYNADADGDLDLGRMARRIHAMSSSTPQDTCAEANVEDLPRSESSRGPSDVFAPAVLDIEREQCSPDQRVVYDHIVERIEGHGKLRQTLIVLHGGGGTGKSTLLSRISSTLEPNGILTINTCPTGVGATHLPGGRTFHSAFKAMQKDDLGLNDLELLRLTFTKHVGLVVVDEMSMFSSENLVLLDRRLRGIYQNNYPFGGLSIILAGDFLQLDVTGGTPLCKMIYVDTPSTDLLSARGLFKQFRVFFLTRQHRATECQTQQANLEACRVLPPFNPSGAKYTKQEARLFTPITDLLLRSITRELTVTDIVNDPAWLDDMTILVTGNADKAVLTACTSRLFARRHGRILFRWRRSLKRTVAPELQQLIYDEDANPELFAYFVVGAPAQILDNNNGNVGLGIANGTPCRMHSLSWEGEHRTTAVLQMIEDTCRSGGGVVDLPFPPDFINVTLLDSKGALRSASNWPDENNLEKQVGPSIGGVVSKTSVVIPIGVMSSKAKKRSLHLGRGVLETSLPLDFERHAVDIAFVMTVWKAQGCTLKRVVLNLEPADQFAPKWGFEHIYVAISRVRAAAFLRCLPLSGAFRPSTLAKLRPNTYTTRWRLDHNN